ncbi:MAG: hypothetical protein AABX73_03895 [Nanoarchaeota archaeon]
MRDLRNPYSALKYLLEREYARIGFDRNTGRLSYKDNTGDGSWEESMADRNNWVREEMSTCCIRHSIKDRSANYCSNCGVGVNGIVTWINIERIEYQDSISEKVGKEYLLE